MTDLLPLQPTQRAVTPPAPASSETAGGTMISSDFETFLRMLTAQVQNQDPLNPLDSTDFAVQLATFSGVEQQVLTNDLLNGLSGSLAASGLSQLAGWVGMEARVAAPVAFSGTPVSLDVAPEAGAARAELLVRDPSGRIWDRYDLPTISGATAWSGLRADGTPFDPGTYSFEVISYDETGAIAGTSTPLAYGRVTEARAGPDGPELMLEGGSIVAADAVSAIRAP